MAKQPSVEWPKKVADAILMKCHHRCCICPEHRRVVNIHHIDEDPSNSVEENGVGLCGECHPDVHSTSTMRRNITADQIRLYKNEWEKACATLAVYLQSHAKEFRNCYYMNVYRLDALFREVEGESAYSAMPHRYPHQDGYYNTLWPNPKNSLDWVALGENRNHFEACFRQIMPQVTTFDINLIELGAVSAEDRPGTLVSFTCQFIGKDIPDQTELVEGLGRIDGPTATMRREIIDHENESVFETCMMIDPMYMYADSSFIQFSEHGVWNVERDCQGCKIPRSHRLE